MLSELAGPRVVVRRFRTTDLDSFLTYQALPEVRRYLPGEPMDATAAASYIATQATMPDTARDSWHAFAIEHIAARRVIGDAGVWLSSAEGRGTTGDVGLQLDPAWQGDGLAMEAMRLLLPWVFTAFGLGRIIASCDRANLPSATLLRRLGMGLVAETADELSFEAHRASVTVP